MTGPTAGAVVGAATATPPRRPGSVRRTSHVDMMPHGELMAGGLTIVGRARDIVTDALGRAPRAG